MTASDVVIRPATAEDIEALYAGRLTKTVRAWAVDYRGKLACLAGIMIEQNRLTAFSEMVHDIAAPRSLIWKTAQKLVELITASGAPLLVVADDKHPNSFLFLKRLGFRFLEHRDGKDYFAWPIH